MLGCFRRRKRRRIEYLTANRLALRVDGRRRLAATEAQPSAQCLHAVLQLVIFIPDAGILGPEKQKLF